MKIFNFTLVALLWLFAFTTFAQEEKKDTLALEINPITISATRYPERVLEVPYAISIISSKDLIGIKGYGLDEVLSSVPGVLAQTRAGTQDVRIVIRGFGARGAGDRSNSGTTRGIRVMLDGIPETEPDGRTSFDMIDLSLVSRVEVIRSNASALWGNAAGGVISLTSFDDFTTPYSTLTATGGSFGLKKLTLKAGAPFSSGRISASFSHSSYDGWRNHSSAYRSLLNIGIQSQLSAVSNLGVYLLAVDNRFNIPGPLTLDQYTADPKQANTTYDLRDERRHNRLGRIGVTLDHSFNEQNEISAMAYINPKYLQRSERNTFRDFTRYHFGSNLIYRNFSNISSSLRNILSVGADQTYQDGALLFYSLSATNGRGSTLSTNKREGAGTSGAFVQTELILNDELSVILGGRYDAVTYYSEDFLKPAFGMQEKTFEKFTPKIGVTYRLTPFHSIYANVGGGVEVPAGNETDPAGTYGQDTVYLLNPLLEPIKSTTYELGTKQVFLGEGSSFIESFSYDVALYHISVENDIVPYRGGRFYFTAGKTSRTGVEIGAEIKTSLGVSLKGSLTYANNTYDTYLVDSVHYAKNKAGVLADYSGNKVAGIPDMFYNLKVKYEPQFLPYIFTSVDVNGMGDYFVDDVNSLKVDSYSVINLTLGMRRDILIGNTLGIRGFVTVNNVLDTKYAASAFINPDYVGGKAVYLEPGLPQNILATVSFTIL